MITAYEYQKEYNALVIELELEMTTSDAQSVAEVELFKKYGIYGTDLALSNREAWIEAYNAIEKEEARKSSPCVHYPKNSNEVYCTTHEAIEPRVKESN